MTPTSTHLGKHKWYHGIGSFKRPQLTIGRTRLPFLGKFSPWPDIGVYDNGCRQALLHRIHPRTQTNHCLHHSTSSWTYSIQKFWMPVFEMFLPTFRTTKRSTFCYTLCDVFPWKGMSLWPLYCKYGSVKHCWFLGVLKPLLRMRSNRASRFLPSVQKTSRRREYCVRELDSTAVRLLGFRKARKYNYSIFFKLADWRQFCAQTYKLHL